jgi:hypothetical protein
MRRPRTGRIHLGGLDNNQADTGPLAAKRWRSAGSGVTIGREVALGGSRAGHGLHDDVVLQRNGAQAVEIGKVVMTPSDAVVRERMT